MATVSVLAGVTLDYVEGPEITECFYLQEISNTEPRASADTYLQRAAPERQEVAWPVFHSEAHGLLAFALQAAVMGHALGDGVLVHPLLRRPP